MSEISPYCYKLKHNHSSCIDVHSCAHSSLATHKFLSLHGQHSDLKTEIYFKNIFANVLPVIHLKVTINAQHFSK